MKLVDACKSGKRLRMRPSEFVIDTFINLSERFVDTRGIPLNTDERCFKLFKNKFFVEPSIAITHRIDQYRYA